MNNMLAWKSNPRPVAYPRARRLHSNKPPITQAGVIMKSVALRASSVSVIGRPLPSAGTITPIVRKKKRTPYLLYALIGSAVLLLILLILYFVLKG